MENQNHKTSKAKNETKNERISITTGTNASHPIDLTKRKPGETMEEHSQIEAANAYIAEKEIQQKTSTLLSAVCWFFM